MTSTESRIFPLPSGLTRHAIVTMPKTAWYWLDDLVAEDFPHGGYPALMRAFNQTDTMESVIEDLKRRARERCDRRMAALYNLANDNQPIAGAAVSPRTLPAAPDLTLRMPSVYRLFHFLAHPTYLTTVWERRNYHLER